MSLYDIEKSDGQPPMVIAGITGAELEEFVEEGDKAYRWDTTENIYFPKRGAQIILEAAIQS